MELLEVSKEMNVQDNCGTRLPIWVVYEDVCIYDTNRSTFEHIRRVEETEDIMCKSCSEKFVDGTAPDDCYECDPDCFVSYKIERQPNLNAGFFFTQKACQEHIDQNHYHYNNPAPYAEGVWRNPELELVIAYLKDFEEMLERGNIFVNFDEISKNDKVKILVESLKHSKLVEGEYVVPTKYISNLILELKEINGNTNRDNS